MRIWKKSLTDVQSGFSVGSVSGEQKANFLGGALIIVEGMVANSFGNLIFPLLLHLQMFLSICLKLWLGRT